MGSFREAAVDSGFGLGWSECSLCCGAFLFGGWGLLCSRKLSGTACTVLGTAIGAVEEVFVPGGFFFFAAIVADADMASPLGAAIGTIELLAAPGGFFFFAAVHAFPPNALALQAELGGVFVHEDMREVEASGGGYERPAGDGVAAHGVHGYELHTFANLTDPAKHRYIVCIAADKNRHVIGAWDGGVIGHGRGKIGIDPLVIRQGIRLFAEIDFHDVHLVTALFTEEIVEYFLFDGIITDLVDGDCPIIAGTHHVHFLPAHFCKRLGDNVGNALVIDFKPLLVQFVEECLAAFVKPTAINKNHRTNGHDWKPSMLYFFSACFLLPIHPDKETSVSQIRRWFATVGGRE